MELKNYNTYFFFGVLLLVSMATFFIFQPFLIAIVLAAVAATLFQGLFSFFLSLTGNRRGLSSLVTSLVILLLIVIPLTIVIALVVGQITSVYLPIANAGDSYQKIVEPLLARIQQGPLYHSPAVQQALSQESFTQYSAQFGQLVLAFVQKTYQGAVNIIFLMFVVFFSLYYFFKDGKKLVKKVMYISPLRDSHEKLLIEKFISISRATTKSVLVIGILQGLVGGIAFAIAGIPSPAIWGVAMGVLSLIPLFGSGIIWMPVAVIMLVMGNIWQGIFLIAIGFGVMSLIDNLLRPKLVGRDTQMHPLLVFFATLGGLSIFGIVGFIIGPIIVALFVSLWDIYGVEFKAQLKKYNS